MSIIKYLRLPFRFEPALLKEDLHRLEHQPWHLHYQTRHYEGNWSAIPLRSVGGEGDNILVAPDPEASYADTAFLEQCPYFREVLSAFRCPLLGVRLLKLEAGALIRKHRDAELSYEQGEIRIHIPVITHPDVEFLLDGERMRLEEGDCWYMNFNLPHSLRNDSPVHRVHLVIDAKVNDWVRELFAQPGLLGKRIADPAPDPETQRRIIASLRQLNTETANRLADEMESALTGS